jgi:hypothetical protein
VRQGGLRSKHNSKATSRRCRIQNFLARSHLMCDKCNIPLYCSNYQKPKPFFTASGTPLSSACGDFITEILLHYIHECNKNI